MTFFKTHPLFLVAAVMIAGILIIMRPKVADLHDHLSPVGKTLLKLALPLFGMFYIAFYLLRPVYYTPYHGGSTGDSYMFMEHALRNFDYFMPRHLYFPTIPAKIFEFLATINVFNPSDPFYLEKAYAFFSLPNRILAALGFFFLFLTFRRMKFEVGDAWFGVGFTAVSFGYWFWALQSNSMGGLLPLECAALYASARAVEERSNLWHFLSGLLISLCLFVHISCLFIITGMALAVAWLSKKQIRNLAAFAGAIFLMAAAYLYLAYLCLHTTDPAELLAGISDYNALGRFAFGPKMAIKALLDGISVPATLLFGLLQAERASRYEMITVIFILGLAAALVGSFIFSKKRFQMTPALFIASVSYFVSIMGFGTRLTWLQYYAAITPIAAVVFLGFLFSPASENGRFNRVLVALVTMCMLGINGFSSTRVYTGEKVEECLTYRELNVIAKASDKKTAIFFGRYGEYYWNQEHIVDYYKLSNKFAHVSWLKPVPIKEVLELAKTTSNLILLDARDYSKSDLFESIETGSDDLPVIYALKSRSAKRDAGQK